MWNFIKCHGCFIESPAYSDIARCLKRFFFSKLIWNGKLFSSIEKYYLNFPSAVFLWYWHTRWCIFVSEIHVRTTPPKATGSCRPFSCIRRGGAGLWIPLLSCRNVQVERDLPIKSMMMKPPLFSSQAGCTCFPPPASLCQPAHQYWLSTMPQGCDSFSWKIQHGGFLGQGWFQTSVPPFCPKAASLTPIYQLRATPLRWTEQDWEIQIHFTIIYRVPLEKAQWLTS